MAISAEFAALHRPWWRLHVSEILEWDKKNQTKTNKNLQIDPLG